MAMVVKNNMTAINTLNTLNKNSSALSKSLQKVSSGMKINSAADDASGYAISERMRVQIRSLDQANQNTQNGSSMMKVAEGAVSSTVEILKTLKEKAVNAANDSNTDSDRQTIQKELDQSIDQINDNANVTFNGKYLVDGSKNTIGKATYTALSNQSLSEDTKATTKLTDLAARNGDSLEIHDTDKVTVSYVQAGKTYSTTFQVKDEETGKIATLQDVFLAAEGINKDTQIFASANNESITKALMADGMSKADVDSLQQQAKDAVDNFTDAKAVLNGGMKSDGTTNVAVNDSAVYKLDSSTEREDVKAGVDAYNSARLEWQAALGAANESSLKQINTADDDATDAEYLASIAGNANYVSAQAVAGNAGATIGTKLDAWKTAFTSTYGTNGNNVANAVLAANAAFSGTIDDAAIKGALTAKGNEAGVSDTDIANYVDELKTKAAALDTAHTALADADVTDVIAADGTVATGSKYEGYVDAKKDYDDKKAVNDALNGPKLLEGKTVGLAASNDTVETASGQKAITITANTEGIGGQISGLNISITDSEGNVKKSANAALDAFEETVRAQNESKDNAISLQVGAKANQSIKVGLTDMRAEALGLQGADGTKLNISTQNKANAAINVLDNAIQKALDQQTTIGSVESRLEYTSSNLTTASENVQASESTIRDADMAKEMTNYTKNNVLLQAAQSMLAQANQSSSNVLSLLQ